MITKHFAELSAIYIYSVCFSTIKSCRYWDNFTRDAIAENALLFYESLNIENDIRHEDFSQKLSILDAEVDIVYTTRQQGVLSDPNKQLLVRSISMDATNSTGFLMWFSDCCLACIINHRSSSTDYYLVA